MAAYFMIRGLKTLALRVERQSENAMKIVRFLKSHPFVKDVFYPGLETHRNHDVAKKQMRDFGGMMNGPEVGLAVPVHEAKVFLRQALGS